MSSSKTIAPYGSWLSPFSSTQITQKSVRLSEPQLDQEYCYWLEQRPQEKGRSVIIRQKLSNSDNSPEEVTPKAFNVHSRIHEYGGGNYLAHKGIIYFVNAQDQRVYQLDSNKKKSPQALSPEGNYRYADFCIDEKRQQLICACEIYQDDKEPQSNIISLKLDGSSTVGFNILAFGNDFYSHPRLSPEHDKLSWLSWDHPNMPWDSSECWIADFNSFGMLHKHRKVAGGTHIDTDTRQETGESIFQPQWSPTGELLFVSDRTNWWNLYSYNTYNKHIEALTNMEAEFATPQWVFGMSTYGFINSYTLLCTYTQQGTWFLATIDLMSHTLKTLPLPFTHIEAMYCQDDSDSAVFIGSHATAGSAIIHWTQDEWKILARSSTEQHSSEDIAVADNITFNNSANEVSHGFFYAPANSQFQDEEHAKPPLIVMCHGGPTGSTSPSLNSKVQYWTSRGFAVFDINYSGSTGYGREYRRRLYGQWGLKDVDDIVCGVKHLITQGRVHPEQVAIRGSSAGGYSVLAALCFSDIFKAGTSLYGIGDLSALAEDTHKFESRYCDQLVGKYPEERRIYEQRSPINHIEKLNCPVLFLQGLEDKVVPPMQAEKMVNALHNKAIPVAYITFPEEGHGFRQADNIRYSIEAEYAFYSHIFALQPQETLPTIPFFSGEEN